MLRRFLILRACFYISLEQRTGRTVSRQQSDEADDLYREARIENVVTDEKGEAGKLKIGAKVDVFVEADTDATLKKPT